MTKKVVSGIFTFSPPIILIGYIIWLVLSFMRFFAVVGEGSQLNGDPEQVMGEAMGYMMIFMSIYLVQIIFFFIFVGLLIFYLIDINSNKRIEKKMAIIWTVLMVYGGMIVMPVYWFMHILPNPKESKVEVQVQAE